MANIEQLELLQERIGSEPVMPDALDRYRALKMLQQKPVRREGGGQLDTIEDIASKGRYGDTMLMHVNPREVRGLDSLGEMTYNPETGLPEAWLWALPLAGAAIGGIGAKLMDKDPLTGALIGGGIGLGGMGFAGPGAAGMSGLSGLWTGLGPIGQGMVTGGAMGGVSGLFGQSENPMRDMLVGAAMGGAGGALFGGAGTATGAAEAELAASDAFTAGVSPSIEAAQYTVPSAVSKIGATTVVPSPGGTFQQAATKLNPAALATPTSPIMHAPGFRSAPYGSYVRPTPGLGEFGQAINPVDPVLASPRTDITGEISASALDASKADPDKTFFGGLKDWWKDREWYEKAGLAGGAGLLGYGLLSGIGEQAELEEPTPIQPFEKGERKTPLRPIQPLTEEQILAAYSGPSGTGIDTWFQPQVAKEGGLIELYKGGQSQSYSGPSASITYGGAAKSQATSQAAAKSQAALGAAAKLGLGPGLGGKQIGGSEGWTNIGSPQAVTQTALAAQGEAANAKALAAGKLFGHKTGQALGFGLMHSTPGMVMRGLQAAFGGDGPTYSAEAHAAQFSPSLAAAVKSGKGLFGIGGEGSGEGEGEGEGEGATQSFGGTQTYLPANIKPIGLATGGVFEGRVQGRGDGMADQVAFNVTPQTPADIPNTPDMALLSSDEYVVPADVVSMLGNGSSTAGAQSLDKFNQLMRRKAHGTNKQQKELNAGKELSSLV